VRDDIGIVLKASISEGVEALIRGWYDPEDIEVGSLVIARSDSGRDFLLLIDDIKYISRGSEFINEADSSPIERAIIEFIRKRLTESYINATIIAYREDNIVKKGVKIPRLGSKIYPVLREELEAYYGHEDWKVYYPLGYPKVVGESKYAIPISMEDLLNLNFGIFGKAGTGKTYLANLIVSYGLLYNKYTEDKINFLIFDMQGEYSFNVRDDRGNPVGDGVGRILRDEFDIYVVDEDYLNKYSYLHDIRIPLKRISRIELEYILEPLNPPQGFRDNLSAIESSIKNTLNDYRDEFRNLGFNIDEDSWVLGLLISSYTIDKIIERIKTDKKFIEGSGSLESLRSMLISFQNDIIGNIKNQAGKAAVSSYEAGVRRLSAFIDLPISFKEEYNHKISDIVENLYSREGGNVIICFGGRWSRTITLYMALANIIAGRLKNRIDESIARGGESGRKIIIFLEEAHRFLGKGVSPHNPFGKLAREYRKFGVTVVPIDQKPSELDPDVTAMLWTKIVFNLVDAKDIESALLGVEDPQRYRRIIPLLERGEALIYGIGVKMPVILRILNYVDHRNIILEKYKGSSLSTSELFG